MVKVYFYRVFNKTKSLQFKHMAPYTFKLFVEINLSFYKPHYEVDIK